jgi:hypothetical protein
MEIAINMATSIKWINESINILFYRIKFQAQMVEAINSIKYLAKKKKSQTNILSFRK